MKIELNIFTNCTQYAPSIDILKETFYSFVEVFDYLAPTIWLDPNPLKARKDAYIKNLNTITHDIRLTSGLADGYVKAINETNADFLFMLEHDWKFNHKIIHTLEELMELMKDQDLFHLRFNKRQNKIAGWDKKLIEHEGLGIKYCKTNCVSNNPHIIDVKKYKELALNRIQITAGSKGIEEILTQSELEGAIYGPLSYDATVIHLDGRNAGY